MLRKFYFTAMVLFVVFGTVTAQNKEMKATDSKMQDVSTASAPTYGLFSPNDQFEFGIALGVVNLVGDLNTQYSPGIGIHVRKALDHTFSLRLGVQGLFPGSVTPDGQTFPYGTDATKNGQLNDARNINKAATTLIGGNVDVIIALNNGRWDAGVRKISPYVFGGVGYDYVNTVVSVASISTGPNYTTVPGSKTGDQDLILQGRNIGNFVAQVQGGAGIALRVSDKFNIALEEQISTVFGKRASLLDGYEYKVRDFLAFTHVRLNFNVGGGAAAAGAKGAGVAGAAMGSKTLPLWWTGPADEMNARVADLEKRPKFDPTDTDGDGVIDMFDQEPNTPAGARVDTRGVALDSDGDGIPDYKDKEPFSPPGYKVDANGVALVPKPAYVTEADVDRIVDAKLSKFKTTFEPTTKSGSTLADWFLPMIHFDLNSAKVKDSELGNVSAVASVIKSNPSIKILVNGFTDRLASDGYNQGLSYRRALSTVDVLVKRFGVDRNSLVLNYEGENNALVSTSKASYMNRRVEFHVAKTETEMAAPARELKSKSYKGNKKAGY